MLCMPAWRKEWKRSGVSANPRVYAFAASFQIIAQQWLAASDGDEDTMGIGFAGNAIKHPKKVLARHVNSIRQLSAVAATMAACDITPERTLPKQLSQGMFPTDVAADACGKLES